ncbi:hypothetical protein [Rhizobium sp. ZX09]|uniref:hypothetical protein n=1 Tax=Rhizobium sp. ZX09 TaxID=2291939 RepID=UPI001A99E164|nr:hypothetical protein [Rhizobium sp. ZX09]QSZ57727.1 hypothetical protein BTN45_11890 [Rhizobium sp. ZX09]
MERLRKSASFNGSDRLLVLLNYVVEETLGGRGKDLKEATIGNEVYRRDPPYDPRIDSTVRVEARRLRRKLEEHFSGDGLYDPVLITIPSGSYTPFFELNTQQRASPAGSPAVAKDIFRPGPGTRLAVLPIKVISGGAEIQEFADALTDELVFAFGSEPGLKVPSRATTFSYRDKEPAIPMMSAELGLDAIVQGTVRQVNGRVKVTVEISDPRGFVVTSDRFESASPNLGELTERMATTFVSRLRFDSSKMRNLQISPGPVAVDSHAKIYRARQLLDKQTTEGIKAALQLFRDVAATAPDYARGHSGIADCFCDLFRIGAIDEPAALAQAKPAAEEARRIDPESPEAYAALGTIHAWLERDRSAAEDSFEISLSLGRNARSARIYGSYLALLGLTEEAEQLFREARTIEPFSQQQDIAESVSRFQDRQFDWLIEKPLEIEVGNAPAEALYYMALSSHFGGRSYQEEFFLPLERLRIGNPQLIFASAELAAWRGATDTAERTLGVDNPRAGKFAYATLASAVGDRTRALSYLSEALDARELATVWMRTDVRFDFIRDSTEFRALIDRLEALRLS